MKTLPKRHSFSSFIFTLILFSFLADTCALSQSVDVWTWHNDNWRTGQNTSESSLTPSNVNSLSFGQICSYAVDGQVYAQPLVLSGSLTIGGNSYTNVVYVATMNDSVYLFNGTNCSLIASAVTGTSTSLIPSTEAAVNCGTIGAGNCLVIKPLVGILGTPVIDEDTNHIYLVTYSYSSATGTYYHRIHALFTGLASGTTPLAEDTTYNSPAVISSGSFTPAFLSQAHIQRPGLLLLPGTDTPDPELYIAFSMMDGRMARLLSC